MDGDAKCRVGQFVFFTQHIPRLFTRCSIWAGSPQSILKGLFTFKYHFLVVLLTESSYLSGMDVKEIIANLASKIPGGPWAATTLIGVVVAWNLPAIVKQVRKYYIEKRKLEQNHELRLKEFEALQKKKQ